MKIYYRGEGYPVVDSAGTVHTQCKVVMYAGKHFVFPPPGKSWEWKRLLIPNPDLISTKTKTTYKQKMRLPIVTGEDPTRTFSYMEVTPEEAKNLLREECREGLYLEKDFFEQATPEELDAQIEFLQSLKPKGLQELEKKRGPGRPKKQEPVAEEG